MRNRNFAWLLTAPLLFASGAVFAQDNGDDEQSGLPTPAADEARSASGVADNENASKGLEIADDMTMRAIEDAEAGRPDSVTANLPMRAGVAEDAAAVANAQSRMETAGDQGVAAIEDARSVAAEQAQEALEAAQEAVEQRGRGNRPDDVPANPDTPEPPVDPGNG